MVSPVTDPELLAQFNAEGPVTDPELLKQLNSAPAAAQKIDVPWTSELGYGVVHGLNLASRGLTDTMEFMVGPAVAEPFKKLGRYAASKGFPMGVTDERLARGKKFVEGTGPLSSVGQFAGEVVPAALAAPFVEAKALQAGTQLIPKVLPKALQTIVPASLPAATQVTGNVVSSAALAPKGEKADAAEGAAYGTVAGSTVGKVLTKGVDLAKRGYKRIVEELSPEAGSSARALRALERTLGKEEVAQIADKVGNPTPSALPRTTAATSGSEKMGAMERGARARGGSDFIGHDKEVDQAAWGLIKGATKNADDLPGLSGQHSAMFREGQQRLNKIPLSKANREQLGKELLALRNSQEVIGDTTGMKAKDIDRVLQALDHPEATLGVLPELYTSLGDSASGSTAISRVREAIKKVADARSKGEFTNVLEGYGATKDAMRAAEASAQLRGKLMSPEGIPLTPKYSGEAGRNAVPNIQSAPLRRATAGQAEGLAPTQVNQMNELADQLRAHEIYKSPGNSVPDIGKAEGVATAGLNAGPLWRLRGTIGAMFGPVNEKTTKAIDEALLKPDKFLALLDERRAANAYIPGWEAKLEKIIRSSGQAGARVGAAIQSE